jgi:hypothetical protein
VTSISRKGVKDGRRRRCVGDGEKNEETDCQRLPLASRRPAVATGSFASRQIAALFHLRLPMLFGRNKLRCPELELPYTSNLRGSFCSIITIINSLGAPFVPKNLLGPSDKV